MKRFRRLLQVAYMKGTQHNNMELPADSPEEVKPVEEIPTGEWMTVTEMGKLLGLQRTERYWLVHKNVFETKMILGKMRVNVASFEDWYSRQIRYHKITGEEPGRKVKEVSYSAQDISELLGISEDTAYTLIKANHLATETVNYRMRVPKDLFDQWYSHQTRYLTKEDRANNAELFESSISMPQMARLLGISRHTVYSILRSETFGGQFEIVVVAGKKRITKSSFNDFLKSQNKYHLAGDTDRNQIRPPRLLSSPTNDPASYKQGKASSDFLSGSEASEAYDPVSAEQFFSETEQLTDSALLLNSSGGTYLPIAEAVRLAGITRQSIVKHADRGSFEIKNIGGKNWVCRQEFKAWLDERNQKGGKAHGFVEKA